jgi:hypothetical protein
MRMKMTMRGEDDDDDDDDDDDGGWNHGMKEMR